MTPDTTALSYWLNWRFGLCAIWVLLSTVASAVIIWKFEGSRVLKPIRRENGQDTTESLYTGEAWRTSFKAIHPVWLLAYRVAAFIVLLGLLLANVVDKGVGIFFFYTEWTFALVTFYFGLATLLSIYGCWQCRNGGDDGVGRVTSDAERGIYVPPVEENANAEILVKNSNFPSEPLVPRIIRVWASVLQIMYQICGGAVILTDCVFWFLIYPFLTSDSYRLGFIDISFHSLNAVFLFGDAILNCLRFPFFRFAYFILWTGAFVIFQWIVHVLVSMRWPYAFLDLSSPYAPLWYLGVGLFQVPCYGIFALVVRMKLCCLSRLFPDAFQNTRSGVV